MNKVEKRQVNTLICRHYKWSILALLYKRNKCCFNIPKFVFLNRYVVLFKFKLSLRKMFGVWFGVILGKLRTFISEVRANVHVDYDVKFLDFC